MSRHLCSCPDPNCSHLPWSQQYSSSSKPQPQWAQYPYPTLLSFSPWSAMIPQLSVPSFQTSDYQHSFQSQPAQPSDSPAFRVALGDSMVNAMDPEQLGSKHKCGKGTTHARKCATAMSLHTIPAVAGVGPSTRSTFSPTTHPAFVQTHTSLGSLVEKGSGRTQGASDVWYFVWGLYSIIWLDTLPEKETLCEKQPNPKEFSQLGCQLCTYISNI